MPTADEFGPLAALKKWFEPVAGVDPNFGAIRPTGEPADMLGRSLLDTLTLPRRAIEASENYRLGGAYDPAPFLESALLTMGGTSLSAPRGAVGAGPVRPKAIRGAEASEPGYAYHATSGDNFGQIGEGGLRTHKPHEFTDQTTWPDAATEKRNYFTPTAENTWQFAPPDGPSHLLRVPRDAHPIVPERGTGDLYSTKPVAADRIGYLDETGKWSPLSEHARMTRAVEQGYDVNTPLYHGTSKDKEFAKFKDSRHGTWTTQDAAEASRYAVENDSRGFRRSEAPGAKPWDMEATNTADRVLPLYGKPLQNPYVMSEYPEALRTATNYKKAQSDWFDTLKAQGHDGVIMPGGTRVDFNNANLRGQFAKFDPANEGKSMILGAGAGDKRGALGAAATDAAVNSRARDPKMWSPISDVKLTKPLSELEHTYTDVRTPTEKVLNPEDLLGKYGIFTPSDLSTTGKTLTHVDRTRLDRPVRAHGGTGFIEENPGMAWASEAPVAKKLDNQAARLADQTGEAPYIFPMTMSAKSIDASHHVAGPLSEMAQRAKIMKPDAEAFDTLMRTPGKGWKGDPNWPGIQHPDFQNYIDTLQGGMKIKAKMADTMGKREWQAKGFPDVAAIRHAMSVPELIDAPRNTIGMTSARWTPGKGLLDTSHPSYSKGVAGEYTGRLPELVPFDVMAPDIASGIAARNAANMAAGKKVLIQPAYHMQKPTEGIPTAQKFDEQWLERMLKHIGRD